MLWRRKSWSNPHYILLPPLLLGETRVLLGCSSSYDSYFWWFWQHIHCFLCNDIKHCVGDCPKKRFLLCLLIQRKRWNFKEFCACACVQGYCSSHYSLCRCQKSSSRVRRASHGEYDVVHPQWPCAFLHGYLSWCLLYGWSPQLLPIIF